MKSVLRSPRRLLAVLGLVVAAVLVAPPVMAVTWYSAGDPLKVTEGGVAQGYAYGDFKNNSGVSARSYSWQKDPRPGGDGIYVETAFYFYEPCGTGTTEWCYSTKKQTTNTTSGSWIADYTARYLRAEATQARGQMKVCENHSWASDPCSAQVTRSFAY